MLISILRILCTWLAIFLLCNNIFIFWAIKLVIESSRDEMKKKRKDISREWKVAWQWDAVWLCATKLEWDYRVNTYDLIGIAERRKYVVRESNVIRLLMAIMNYSAHAAQYYAGSCAWMWASESRKCRCTRRSIY